MRIGMLTKYVTMPLNHQIPPTMRHQRKPPPFLTAMAPTMNGWRNTTALKKSPPTHPQDASWAAGRS